jgi:hypothetical protein
MTHIEHSAQSQRDAILNYRVEDLARAFVEGMTLVEKAPETHLHALIEETLDFHARKTQPALSDDDRAFLETVNLLLAHGADPDAALRWDWEPGHEREYMRGETPRSLVEDELQTEPSGARRELLEKLVTALNTRAKL